VVPESAKVVVTDKGWDDDDPIRLRVAVVDIGDSLAGTMLDFYRETYPGADGWKEQKVDPKAQELCLVRKTHHRYSEFVEVFPYSGSRVPAGPGLHLITISRLQSLEPGGEEKTCGLAQGWIPSDVY
jgi:hypothetical protein